MLIVELGIRRPFTFLIEILSEAVLQICSIFLSVCVGCEYLYLLFHVPIE